MDIVVLKRFVLICGEGTGRTMATEGEAGVVGTGRTMVIDGAAGDVGAGGHTLTIRRLCNTVIPTMSVHMECATIELMEWELVHLRGVGEDGVGEDGVGEDGDNSYYNFK